ncbi:hypothetical protein J437_LFUL008814, partial [Ladona fulva]
MKLVSKEKLINLQKDPSAIRNICIMAHVDHGKTTLADSLVANNGIISPRMAGKLRYLDSRRDEQERGITMKSSSIALYHVIGKESKEYLINLIDSPGHVDFSSEVSTAVRLCDGAIVVVDVVEGVGPQTKVSLKQAWEENIKIILVLNKLDRLIVEMKLTPLDAYICLIQILEQVNAVMGELFATSVLGKVKTSDDSEAKGINDVYDWSTGLEEEDDSHLYFSPDQGNVIFASAIDGWGFDIRDFAKTFSSKLNIDENLLKKTLWGDYYLHSKSMKILKGAQSKAKKPLFAQLILESIWSVYDTIVTRKEKDKIPKIADRLGIKLTARDLRHTDCKVQLQAVMNQWLPLANSLLDMVCMKLPSPLEICDEKVDRIFNLPNYSPDKLPEEIQSLKSAFKKCSSESVAPVIIFISKMFPVEKKHLPANKQRPLTNEEILKRREQARKMHAEKTSQLTKEGTEDSTTLSEKASVYDNQSGSKDASEEKKEEPVPENDDTFIAFARVYSGTVRKGARLYVLGPKHDPLKALDKYKDGDEVDPLLTLKDLKLNEHVTMGTIDELYMLMGRELEVLEIAFAGNIIGIGGLEEHVLKSATLSSSMGCPAFAETVSSAGDTPILRVAVEPHHPSEMSALVHGLHLLNQADAAVQVLLQESGEHVLATAGEIEINVSEPIVPFRETIVVPPKVDMVNEVIQEQNTAVKKAREEGVDENGLVTMTTPNKRSVLKIKAVPLPESVTDILMKHSDLMKVIETEYDLLMKAGINSSSLKKHVSSLSVEMADAIKEFKSKLEKAFADSGKYWENAERFIWSFGPKRSGPNILLNKIPNAFYFNIWGVYDADTEDVNDQLSSYGSSFVNGFQLATLAGPMCEEPMMGVCFVVEDWNILNAADDPTMDTSTLNQPYGPFSGQLMSAVKEGCRKAFQAQPQRLMAAMYSCSIYVNAEVL